ncbi:outer membrane receptor protein [Echinicola vietnamensis DSM 17526]|uniref:Outer membrane receptor protein n=1 Tax=Echinicola vietnamensis (strain DSM 17526 / LMG 23754 / KMM 6221) TaxID=926556 RepID=L0G310_ECHVK|nr:outer membrane receptor protein [Echinicola vietnamensis DSM 17526]
MNKVLKIIYLSLFLPLASVYAQDQKGNERGEVTDAEFIIRKDRVLSLPKRTRNFETVPALPQPERKSSFSYGARDFFFTLPPSQSEIKPYQKQFPTGTESLYHSLARIGYGNYQSPLAELYVNNLQSDYLNYGVMLRHQGFYEGPVDKKNSAEDHTNIRLNANYFTEFVEVFGEVGYDRDRYHFYGYTPGTEVMAEDIQQLFSTIYGKGGVRNIAKDDPFNYEAKIGLRLFNDDYNAREHQFSFEGLGYYNVNDDFRAGLDVSAYVTSPSDVGYNDINRNYAKLTPFVRYKTTMFEVNAGVNLVNENDVYDNKNGDFHVFPKVDATYYIHEAFAVYGQYIGDVKRNTYYGFAMENPYLGPSDRLLNTVQKFKAEGGIKGSVNDAFTYKLGVAYGDYDNMHFYANGSSDSTRFELLYNDGAVLNYTGSLGYSLSDRYHLTAEANYYHYTLDDVDASKPSAAASPWQRPEWEINVHNTFTPDEKWLIQAGLDMMGGIYAQNLESGVTDTLDPILDLNAKIDYKITDRLSVFAKGNNLLNQKNERYWNYQSRGIQGIGGVTFKF